MPVFYPPSSPFARETVFERRPIQGWGWIAFGLLMILIFVDCVGGYDRVPSDPEKARHNAGARGGVKYDTSDDTLPANKEDVALSPVEQFERSGATMP